MSESLYHPPQGKFQVGLAGHIQPSDPWFHDERDAMEAARKLHEQHSPYGVTPVGIWDERGDWLYILFDRELFRKM